MQEINSGIVSVAVYPHLATPVVIILPFLEEESTTLRCSYHLLIQACSAIKELDAYALAVGFCFWYTTDGRDMLKICPSTPTGKFCMQL